MVTKEEATLAEQLAARRELAIERLDEAREHGLGVLFDLIVAASDPDAGGSPVVPDPDTFAALLAGMDAAVVELERRVADASGHAHRRSH